jgi:membrane protein DedA with SNARE-associated domain|tara:strand:+ start:332 stop:550 length:219 start_codon:yes stop_codon:yes gene_type:complete
VSSIKKFTISIKGLMAILLWALAGYFINNLFDPNTVTGSVMGSIFVLIWAVILFIGFLTWIKFNKKKKREED